jgi:hypothetical protein
MVNLRPFIKSLALLIAVGLLSPLWGCVPASKLTVAPDLKVAPEKEIVYIIPFTSTLVPNDIAETVFNELVDNLNDNNKQPDIRWFSIIKEEVPPEWLTKQVYLTGEMWSYMENSGCCSTEIKINARLLLHEPGKDKPTLELFVPLESFFEHDRSSLEIERLKFAKKLAGELSGKFLQAIEAHRKPH